MTPRKASAASGRLPNFLLIGAMKAGTTSLYHYLQGHPQVFVPQYKAPEYFVAESNFRRGIDWYRKQFAGAGPAALAVGEASNAYAKYPKFDGVPQRIANCIPDVRLVYIVRDPIARIRSHYQTRVAEGTERLPFDEAIFTNAIYLNYSRYALQIDRYLECFRREQMIVITAEDLRLQRAVTVRAVYEFLGVDPTFSPGDLEREFYQTKDRAVHSPIPLWLRKGLKKYVPASKRFKELENNLFSRLAQLRPNHHDINESSKSLIIGDVVRRKLIEHLQDDVRRLKRYMASDFTGWGIA
jgi:hypothetical protein